MRATYSAELWREMNSTCLWGVGQTLGKVSMKSPSSSDRCPAKHQMTGPSDLGDAFWPWTKSLCQTFHLNLYPDLRWSYAMWDLSGSRAARIQAVSYGTARAQIRAAFPRDASAPRHWEPCRRGVSQPEGLSSASSPRDSRQRHKTSGYLEGSRWLECWAWTRMESGHREGQFCQWAVLEALIPQLGNYPHSHLLFLPISSFLNNLLSLSPSTNGYKKQE